MRNRSKNIISKIIHIKGLVQGVGFRPFIFVLAKKFKLKGWVKNQNDGVIIIAEGYLKSIDSFIQSIKKEAPFASNIFSIETENIEISYFDEFKIVKSKNQSNEVTEISPDISICDNCLKDMKEQKHRINYPFTNCTNCGPRFSIIEDLPYDREKTTMSVFEMCEICKNEYTDIYDRRFHAQPVACNDCGPSYELILDEKSYFDFEDILEKTSNILKSGKILALKGLGGFHIACDATNENAVKKLRKLKIRESKPFAVMFSSISSLKEFAFINNEEEKVLHSWQRPIVLLKTKKELAFSISNGISTIGAMLPYMPFHYLLFEKLKLSAIVLTSGNLSDEPIIIDNQTAKEKLTKISDALLIYNRDIYNRTDDSVGFVVNKENRLIRRSRGYAPSPVYLNFDTEGIFATGAELVNCFALGKGNQAIMSQHIGDLKNLETLDFYEQTIKQFKKLFRFKPKLIVSDMHPDYLSSQYADKLDVKQLKVQHHHAHIASCMAEHGIDEKVIGVSFDGTGYGDDGNIWGAEFFVNDLNEYDRKLHFEYIPMPGGDKVTKEPWRMAISYLYSYLGKSFFDKELEFLKNIDKNKVEFLLKAIDKKLNCPLSSSAGRLFDAVSALLNICTYSNFHAEAPMRLESIIDDKVTTDYSFDINKEISFKSTFLEILNDLEGKIPISIIATKFHNTIIKVIFAGAKEIRIRENINKIVLSGGTFQNRFILEKVENLLKANGFDVFSNNKIPSNDGGIALGQLVIAAKRRELKCV